MENNGELTMNIGIQFKINLINENQFQLGKRRLLS